MYTITSINPVHSPVIVVAEVVVLLVHRGCDQEPVRVAALRRHPSKNRYFRKMLPPRNNTSKFHLSSDSRAASHAIVNSRLPRLDMTDAQPLSDELASELGAVLVPPPMFPTVEAESPGNVSTPESRPSYVT